MEDSRISIADHEAISQDLTSSGRDEAHAADSGTHLPLQLSRNEDVAEFQLAQAAEHAASGKTEGQAGADPQHGGAKQTVQITPDQGNIAHLPPNTSIDDIHVEGRNLVVIQADGTRIVIVNGALHVPTFMIGEVTLPQQAVVAALEQQGVNVAAGPDGSYHAGSATSGHEFSDSAAQNARTPLNLIGLLGPDGQFGNGGGSLNSGTPNGLPFIDTQRTEIASLTETGDASGAFVTQSTTGRFGFGGANASISTVTLLGETEVSSNGTQQLTSLTSGGVAVIVTQDGETVTGTANGKTIFTLVFDKATGDYTFTQFAALDHSAGANATGSDVLQLQFQYTVVDKSHHSVTGTATVSVADSVPVAGNGDAGTVTEAALAGGNGSATDAHVAATSATGSLNISWGADSANTDKGGLGDRSVAFTNANFAVTGEAGTALTSHGLVVSTTIVNGTLIGYTGSDVPTATTNANVVFYATVSDTDNGHYSFTLVQSLDDAKGSDAISLTFNYTATDSDGDASTNSFTVTVDDDRPLASLGTTSEVTESALSSGGTANETSVTSASSTGSLNISWGADDANIGSSGAGDRSVAFTSASVSVEGAANDAQLTSHGLTVSTTILADGTLVGYTGSDVPTATTNSNVVFYATVSDTDNGHYNFTLVQSLDDAKGSDAISLTFGYTATDSDGDTSANTFTVTVDDDKPVAGLGTTSEATESALSNGNVANETSVTSASSTASLNISWGADDANNGSNSVGDRSVAFTSASVSVEGAASDAQLTSHGLAVSTTILADGTLVGYTGENVPSDIHGKNVVFYATVSDADAGSYNFTLVQSLADGVKSDAIHLTFSYTTTDSDGDASTNSFTVTVDDDKPVAFDAEVKEGLYDGNTTSVVSPPPPSIPLELLAEVPSQENAPSSNTDSVSGTLFKAGADGFQKLEFTDPSNLKGIYVDADGVGHVETLTFKSVTTDGTTVYTATGEHNDVIFTLTVQADGSYTFQQTGALAEAKDADNSTFTIGFTVTDGDGDSASGSLTLTVGDASPSVTISSTNQSIVIGESGIPHHNDDVSFWNRGELAALHQIFSSVDHAANNGNAIAYAHSDNAVVSADPTFGADGQATNNAVVYSLTLGASGENGLVDSGLKTTDGHEIYLYSENGLIVGRYSTTDGGTPTTAAFAIEITQDGKLNIVQYASLSESDTSQSHEIVSILSQKVYATVTVTDGDQDTAQDSVDISGQIQFQDDGPKAIAESPKFISEDSTSKIRDNVFDTSHAGADGATLTSVTLNSAATWHGHALSNYTFTVSTGQPTVIKTDQGVYTFSSDGSWSFDPALNQNNKNGEAAGFSFTITDGDGDTSTAIQQITIKDGQNPTVSGPKGDFFGQPTVSLILNEADLKNGTSPNAQGKAEQDSTRKHNSLTFTAHSDDIAIAFGDPSAIKVDGLAKGETIAWVNKGTTLEGHLANADGSAGALLVTLKLTGQLTADAGGNTATPTIIATLNHALDGSGSAVTINGIQVVATDTDGDTATGLVKMTVADDAPVAGLGAAGTAYEASLPEGEGGKGISATAVGSLNVTWGADGHQAVAFFNESVSVSGEAGAVLTSHGLLVHTTVLADGTLVGFTGDSASALTDANVVFYSTLSDSGKGAYSFTLVQSLDHASGGNPLTLTFEYTATDSDGDSASNSFTVSVVDDVPVAGASIADQTLTENNLIDASGSLVSDGISTGEIALNFSFGADGPAKTAVTFASQAAASNITLTDGTGHVLDLSHLTSGGNALQYALSSDHSTLTAYYLSDGHEVTVFTVSLSENGAHTSGAYDFTLYRPLSDSDATDFHLSFAVVGHDGDGDTTAVSQSFSVDIHNDIPTANNWSITTNAAPGETITIPTEALLWAASGAHATDLTIAKITGSVATLNGDSVAISVTGQAETFDYTVSDGLHETVATASLNGHWNTIGTSANEIFVAAQSGNGDTIIGGLGNDVLIGSANTAENVLYGDGTTETAHDGNDLLIGGINSTNTMYGGGGDDTLIGAQHALNKMDGGSGNDTLIGAANATNEMHGGSGDDVLSGGHFATNTMDGGSGDNTFIAGLFSVNTMIGGSGNDTFQLIENSFNTVTGGGGNNTLDFSRFDHAIEITLTQSSTSTHFDVSGGGLDYSDINGIIGTSYDDIIIGGDHSNFLSGGAGNDILTGGAGNDMLDGGSGFNLMTGGAGADTFIIDASALSKLDPADVIADFHPTTEGDKLDVSGLIDALMKQDSLSEGNAINRLTAVVDDKTNTTTINVNTGTETHAVATLENFSPSAAGVKILYDHHEHALTTTHTG
ncbi:DUF5801 repeats-in-toxin domain-containing protein (plasmid) [Rhizobium sp. CB3171]|uniref:T1SS-143 repeat domain-containing protein n=1 Tax=Rhizobium sp. CB3171 TaxID=3039157 RepID=UPI0024B13021|nr:DUF5801 repeats-in-toxin domain-containing protein [Rhizobium sp. CB3171]WFU07161.1 DUF5801 repeats-in-toxin domain-containing protein [Rhizobium sp. CB3171]